MTPAKAGKLLKELYEKLWQAFGPQGWWPGETPFEVAVGAILTQNTNWNNVARVMARLKDRRPPDGPGLDCRCRRRNWPGSSGRRAITISRPGG